MTNHTRTVETTGPDIEQAIEAGLEQLDVSRESVIVEVLEEPSRGLLGIGARMARVRLTTAVPPRSQREAFSPSEVSEVDSPATAAPSQKQVAENQDIISESEEISRQTIQNASEGELDDEVQIGVSALRELLQHMDVEARVAIEKALGESDKENNDGDDVPWILHVRGDDLGFLIGRRGETLAALQYITRLIASRDLQRRAEFILDIENYKARREILLRKLALRMANEAIKRGRRVEMEPMPPHERRIIHMTLRNHDKVQTESRGDGSRRRVTIIPR